MLSAAILVILAIAMLLLPDLRAQPTTWIIAGVLVAIAAVLVIIGPLGSKSIRSARQVKYQEWWGYTSHDGTSETDVREKLGK